MTRVVRGVSLLFSGLFAGFLVCVLVLEISLRGYGASVYTQVRLVELDSLDRLASVTLLPALVATVVLAIRSRGVAVVAVGLLVGVFVLTLVVNLPINSDQVGWSVQSPPSDWSAVRDRWQVAHAVRTGLAVVAFGLLVVGSQRRAAVSRVWETAAAVRPS
jgi:hypothetical protein